MSAIVKSLQINPRYDLQSPYVLIKYEINTVVDGQNSLRIVKDFYPSPLPTDPQSHFASLQFTVDLQGFNSTTTKAAITVSLADTGNSDWWLRRHPQYKPFDSSAAGTPPDPNNNIANISFDFNSVTRTLAKTGETDRGFTNELTAGQLTSWMNVSSQRIVFSVNATVTYRDGHKPKQVNLKYTALTTNAVTKTYSTTKVNNYAEPIPFNLARDIYDAVSVLQQEGSVTLQEEDCSGQLTIGNTFNLIGGQLAEWTNMNAMVQQTTENLDAGTTEVQFGPPRHLSVGELVDLLRVNRRRFIYNSYSMQTGGSSGRDDGGTIELGSETPEKNSSSSEGPANPHVISASQDGSGPGIFNSASGGDASTVWANNPGSLPGPGSSSVTISLNDAGGAVVKLRRINVCQDGIAGQMVILCSDFFRAS